MKARDRWLMASVSAVTAAALFFVWSATAALRISPTAEAAAPQFTSRDSLAGRATLPALRISDAVDLNVFAPDRSAPVTRYSLTGEPEFPVFAEEPEPVVLPEVLGTAVGEGTRSFAMCQLNGSPSVLLRVGDQLGDFTVRSISRGAVEFSTPSGERVTIAATSS